MSRRVAPNPSLTLGLSRRQRENDILNKIIALNCESSFVEQNYS